MAIQSSGFGSSGSGSGNGTEPPERLVGGRSQHEDEGELTLRPKRLSEYIGQPKIKERLGLSLTAAKMLGQALDHVLLSGPPGLGKTSLANVISNEIGANLKATSGPAIEKPGDLVAMDLVNK